MTPYSKRGPHPPPDGPDLEALAEALKALANPARLALLARLAEPTALADLRVRPSREGSHSAERAMTRTAVEKHVRALAEAGLVAGTTDRGVRGRAFAVDRAAFFRVVEDLGRAGPPAAEAAPWPPGPCLVVAGWYDAGRAFPLPGRDAVIGSHPHAEVALPHDPWLAPRHAAVVRAGGGFALRVLAPAEQPTRRNGRVVAPGAEEPLEHGDLLAMGRSALLFRAR